MVSRLRLRRDPWARKPRRCGTRVGCCAIELAIGRPLNETGGGRDTRFSSLPSERPFAIGAFPFPFPFPIPPPTPPPLLQPLKSTSMSLLLSDEVRPVVISVTSEPNETDTRFACCPFGRPVATVGGCVRGGEKSGPAVCVTAWEKDIGRREGNIGAAFSEWWGVGIPLSGSGSCGSRDSEVPG
jgi:hypothetical protein